MKLEAGEEILFRGHPSWRSILGFYLKGVLLAALAGGVAALVTQLASEGVSLGPVAAATAAVLGLLAVIGLVRRLATTYTITNQRLQIRRGIVARHVQQTGLDRIQNVNSNQSVLERLLRVGTVDFDTAGSDDFEFAFAGIAAPARVVVVVERARRELSGLGAMG